MSAKDPVHVMFRQDVETALRQVAEKYNLTLRGTGIAPQNESLVVIARFGGTR